MGIPKQPTGILVVPCTFLILKYEKVSNFPYRYNFCFFNYLV